MLTTGIQNLPEPRLGTPLPQVLRGAMALVGGDFGNIQIVDPASGSLRLVTQAGFDAEFLDYFAVVQDAHSTCGQAARPGAQRAVADVHADPGFALHREIAVREADVSVPFELWVMGWMTVSFARRAARRGPSAQPV